MSGFERSSGPLLPASPSSSRPTCGDRHSALTTRGASSTSSRPPLVISRKSSVGSRARCVSTRASSRLQTASRCSGAASSQPGFILREALEFSGHSQRMNEMWRWGSPEVPLALGTPAGPTSGLGWRPPAMRSRCPSWPWSPLSLLGLVRDLLLSSAPVFPRRPVLRRPSSLWALPPHPR